MEYAICSVCFNATDDNAKSNDDDEKAERSFVFNKIMSSINRISFETHSKEHIDTNIGFKIFRKCSRDSVLQ